MCGVWFVVCGWVQFSTPITIGTQTFSVLVDTGSTTIAVASDQCGSACSQDGNTLSPTYSPDPVSAEDQGETVTASYGSGSWTGRAFEDSVALAGFSSVGVIIGAIDSSTTFFRKSKCKNTYDTPNTYQGILGLAYGSLAIDPTQSYLDQLLKAHPDGSIQDVFAIQMCETSGRLWMSGYDAAFMNAAQLAYTPITDEKWFVIGAPSSITIGGTSIGASASSFGTTIVDSGTTAFILPTSAYNLLTAAISSNQNFQNYFTAGFFDQPACVSLASATTADLNAQLPAMAIVLNGVTLNLLPVSSYLITQYDATGKLFYCSGLSDAGSQGAPMTIMGYAVMNQYTTIFDRAQKRIGFAPTKYCDGTNPPADPAGASWYASAWSVCAAATATPDDHDSCSQSRTVVCKDSNAQTVSDASCASLTKPALSQSCVGYSGVCGADNGKKPIWYYIVGAVGGVVVLCCLCACLKKCCCGSSERENSDNGSGRSHYRAAPAPHPHPHPHPAANHAARANHAPAARVATVPANFTPLVVDESGHYVGGTVGATAGAGGGQFVVIPIKPGEVYAPPAHSSATSRR